VSRAPGAPAGVVLDNDGLTLDTEKVWTVAEERLFARRGRTFTHEMKLELVGSSGQAAAARLERMLGADAGQGPAIYAELTDLVEAELGRGCAPMPGAADLLGALRAAGIPVALCSNSPRRIVEAALAGSGLAGAFDATVALEDSARPKPAPEPYLRAAERLGVPPGACVALEDSPVGVRSARAAGMRVLGVPSVPGVSLDGLADAVHASLADPAVWAAVGLRPEAQPGAGSASGSSSTDG
jgi:HAD superfamily hydrolase (TIGR01509 family)